MIEIGKFQCASLNELLEIYEENELKDIFSSFACSKNSEIELFLKNNAIEFYKKSQAITYTILDSKNELMGYFSLSLKPISIKSDILSNSELKKILRIAELETENNTVNPAAYLIAQLGKSDKSNININVIFDFIHYYIYEAKKLCGGVIEFLESENNDKLINMYQDIGFKTFNIRKSKSGEERKLVQMYRLI